MLTLAVTTDAETFERMGDPLAARGVEVRHLPTTGRTIPLTDSGDADSDPSIDSEFRSGVGANGTSEANETAFDVGFVYPSRLAEGGVVDAILDIPWLNDREAVLTSRNKAGVLATLSRAGVPVPDSTLVSHPVGEADLLEAFERFDPPIVCKPNSATRGIGVTAVGDRDSFLGVSDYLGLLHEYPPTNDKSFLLQEFVPEARDFRAMVLEGEYVGAVERRGAGWKHNVHRGAEAVGVDLPMELRELAERAARVLEIPFVGVDLLVTNERAVVTETNARPTIDAETKYREGFHEDLAAAIRTRA